MTGEERIRARTVPGITNNLRSAISRVPPNEFSSFDESIMAAPTPNPIPIDQESSRVCRSWSGSQGWREEPGSSGRSSRVVSAGQDPSRVRSLIRVTVDLSLNAWMKSRTDHSGDGIASHRIASQRSASEVPWHWSKAVVFCVEEMVSWNVASIDRDAVDCQVCGR